MVNETNVSVWMVVTPDGQKTFVQGTSTQVRVKALELKAITYHHIVGVPEGTQVQDRKRLLLGL